MKKYWLDTNTDKLLNVRGKEKNGCYCVYNLTNQKHEVIHEDTLLNECIPISKQLFQTEVERVEALLGGDYNE